MTMIKPCIRKWVALEQQQLVVSCHFWGHRIQSNGQTLAFRSVPTVTITEFVFDAARFGEAVAKVVKPDLHFTLSELRRDAARREWIDVLDAIGPLSNAELGLALTNNCRNCRVKKIGTQNGLSLWRVV